MQAFDLFGNAKSHTLVHLGKANSSQRRLQIRKQNVSWRQQLLHQMLDVLSLAGGLGSFSLSNMVIAHLQEEEKVRLVAWGTLLEFWAFPMSSYIWLWQSLVKFSDYALS